MAIIEPRIEFVHKAHKIEYERYIAENQPLHWHEKYELEFVESGKGVHKINEKEYPFKRGCIYLLRLTDRHEIKIEEPAVVHKLRLPTLCLPEKLVRSFLKVKGSHITYMEEEKTEHVQNLFNFLNYCPNDESENTLYVKSAIVNIIMLMFAQQRNEFPADPVKSEKGKVEDVRLYISDHFREKLTNQNIAATFKMNPQYLNRIFSKHVGMAMYAYVKRCRLHYAVLLTVETDLSSMEIYKATGYSSYANFLRDFKELTGESPLKFRKAERQRQAEKEKKNED